MKKLGIMAMLMMTCAVSGSNIEQQDITVTHVVQPGENLHKITRKYLGTDILWQDNWRLNLHLDNPNNLKIGDELTIIKERIIPAEKAKVMNVVNRVEKKPTEGGWLSVVNGDELIQQEGVRTFEKSSALLEFNDESRLKVLEYSQIFLQSRSTGLTGTDSATIEVVKGDAELNWEPVKSNQTEIFIVTGESIATPQATRGQVAELRTGLTAEGNSVFSVYKGNSAVAAAGAEVNVKQGMGVAVKPGQQPPEPKPLLKAPELIESLSGSFAYNNPQLNWQPVADAEAYVFELCADEGCQSVLKQAKVKDPNYQISGLNQAGDFYWRAAAVSVDEIVGFRSSSKAISLSSAEDDSQPPVVAIEVIGAVDFSDETITIGPRSHLAIHAHDTQAGLNQLNYRWGQSEWQPYTGQPISVPTQSSELSVQATDNLGHSVTKQYIIN